MELYTSLTDTILTPPAIPSVKWTGCLAYNGQLLTLVAWYVVFNVSAVHEINTAS